MQICRGFTVGKWQQLSGRLSLAAPDEKDWQCAISVFERRIHERYLSCIETLQANDSNSDIDVSPSDGSTLPRDLITIVVPGFSIMALCRLLVETLHSLREGP